MSPANSSTRRNDAYIAEGSLGPLATKQIIIFTKLPQQQAIARYIDEASPLKKVVQMLIEMLSDTAVNTHVSTACHGCFVTLERNGNNNEMQNAMI